MVTPYLLVGLITWALSAYPLYRYVAGQYRYIDTGKRSNTAQIIENYIPLLMGLLIAMCLLWPIAIPAAAILWLINKD